MALVNGNGFVGTYPSVAALEAAWPAAKNIACSANVGTGVPYARYWSDGIDWGSIAYGWKDLTAPLSAAGVPNVNAPTPTNFGPVVTPRREEYAFAVNNYIFCQAFHVNHDVMPGGLGYVHVHWSTDGTSTRTVKWEFTILRALGHDQANWTALDPIFVEQAASGTAWRHMIAECSDNDAIVLTEPDEIILVTLRRVTNGGLENGDTVFGVTVDFHYQADRSATPNKSPNFYA